MDISFMLKKLIAAFFIIIIYIKVSGRKQLAPLSTTDQIGNMVMGALVSNSIVASDVSILESVVIVAIWASLQLLLRHLKYRSGLVTEIIDGRKYQLIKDGVLQEDEFKEAQLTLLDFENSIHNQDIKSISEIKNAWFDSTGNISLDLKGEDSQSNVLMFNGNFHIDALKRLEISKKDILDLLERNNVSSDKLDSVLCLELFDGKFFLYNKSGTKIIE